MKNTNDIDFDKVASHTTMVSAKIQNLPLEQEASYLVFDLDRTENLDELRTI